MKVFDTDEHRLFFATEGTEIAEGKPPELHKDFYPRKSRKTKKCLNAVIFHHERRRTRREIAGSDASLLLRTGRFTRSKLLCRNRNTRTTGGFELFLLCLR